MLFDTMLSLQPQATGPAAAGKGLSREDKVHLVTPSSRPVFSEVLKFKRQYVTLCDWELLTYLKLDWCFQILGLLADIRGMIPPLIDYEKPSSMLQDDPSPLNVVLMQEIHRYNSLLNIIR